MTKAIKAAQTETYRRLSGQLTNRGPWQQTASGRAFYLADPRPEDVHLEDIADALSRICRYNGQLKTGGRPYFVGQHAYLVSQWLEEDGYDGELVYAGLHHDSGEAFYGDLVSQIKECVPEVRPLTRAVDEAVNLALRVAPLSPERKAIIKDYDMIALATEVRDLMSPNQSGNTWGQLPEPRNNRIIPWPNWAVRFNFLARHYEIKARLGLQ